MGVPPPPPPPLPEKYYSKPWSNFLVSVIDNNSYIYLILHKIYMLNRWSEVALHSVIAPSKEME